jgi:hypothetical protein
MQVLINHKINLVILMIHKIWKLHKINFLIDFNNYNMFLISFIKILLSTKNKTLIFKKNVVMLKKIVLINSLY